MDFKKLAQKELELSKYTGDDEVVSSETLAEELKNDAGAVFSLKTSIPSLDRILNNVEAGELVTVTGPTGHGKTTLLMTITKNMVKENIKAVWFSLEVTPRQFINKLTADGGELPHFYTPKNITDNTIAWVLDRIIEAKVKYDVQVVYIDHLHQIFSIDRYNGKNLSLELGDIVAKIKQIAIEYNLVVFLIAHSTDDKQHVTREPRMMDIRDSGMITRLADTVIGVWRIANDNDGSSTTMDELDETDTRSKVRIWKNRREGKLGYCVMNHENHMLTELDLSHEPKVERKKNYKKKIDDEFENF
jgi:replicative DNA helicase